MLADQFAELRRRFIAGGYSPTMPFSYRRVRYERRG